jgi:hypothetical protein
MNDETSVLITVRINACSHTENKEGGKIHYILAIEHIFDIL